MPTKTAAKAAPTLNPTAKQLLRRVAERPLGVHDQVDMEGEALLAYRRDLRRKLDRVAPQIGEPHGHQDNASIEHAFRSACRKLLGSATAQQRDRLAGLIAREGRMGVTIELARKQVDEARAIATAASGRTIRDAMTAIGKAKAELEEVQAEVMQAAVGMLNVE